MAEKLLDRASKKLKDFDLDIFKNEILVKTTELKALGHQYALDVQKASSGE